MIPRAEVIPLAALRREVAALPQGLVVTCAGRSMEPAVRMGDEVRVRRGPVEPGDVFLFEIPGAVEMHRLIARLPGGWLVHRGDNSASFGWTRVERVVGRCELPRRRPGARQIAAAIAASAWRAVDRQLRR